MVCPITLGRDECLEDLADDGPCSVIGIDQVDIITYSN